MRKQSHFIDNIWHVTWPFPNDFILPATWHVFVRKHQKVCCSIHQWSDVGTSIWCRTCNVRFFRSLLRIFSCFPLIWVCKMKVLWKVASSGAEDLKTVFLYSAKYSVKNFITTRQHVVNLMCNCWFRMCIKFHQILVSYKCLNLTCNCWFRMCIKFHQILVSYKCMHFVDCLVVLREYFVNWVRVMKFQFFSWSTFHLESYVRHHVCHTTAVTWRETFNF